ncbi:FG-GAP repeat domain-containing protein [Conexibacter sp. JD483]|uniref:FG-GAP repeat domain-containing protein n=1 Tax=Conexibacter sp. JD483 TaxID=3064471 RepID=UPI0037BFFE2C
MIGRFPTGVVAADLDGDGNVDLATSNYQSNAVWVARGTGDGSFGVPQSHDIGAGSYAIAAGDVNGDGARPRHRQPVRQRGVGAARRRCRRLHRHVDRGRRLSGERRGRRSRRRRRRRRDHLRRSAARRRRSRRGRRARRGR